MRGTTAKVDTDHSVLYAFSFPSYPTPGKTASENMNNNLDLKSPSPHPSPLQTCLPPPVIHYPGKKGIGQKARLSSFHLSSSEQKNWLPSFQVLTPSSLPKAVPILLL